MITNSTPLVSISMPVLNCAATVAVAVQSILNQTFLEWELLLIDDGSTDETVKILRNFKDRRVRVFADGSHHGHAARLNEAVGISRGIYLARMDGDDVSYPDRLARQLEHLSQHPEIDLLGGDVLVFGRGGAAMGVRGTPTTHGEICRRPWAGFNLAHPTWLGRLKWFQRHPYRGEVSWCQDQDLLLRTFETSRFAALPDIVLGYRELLSLRKILASRRAFAAVLIREGIAKGKYTPAMLGVAEQAAKSAADCLAIGTGLNYRVLRHRALPASESAVREWAEVWEGVQRSALETQATLETIGNLGNLT